MFKVLIYGAGSIGNHLAYASRSKGWDVLMCDIDAQALKRSKELIYPSRYGAWDNSIRLMMLNDIPDDDYDLVVIGTPPASHIALATEILQKNNPPKVLLIEKAFCLPSLEGAQQFYALAQSKQTATCVAYNNTLTKNTRFTEALLAENSIGTPQTMSACFREDWSYILGAHPWLKHPGETYVGFSHQGGGSVSEQSHGLNLWQHFAHRMGMGRVAEVSAVLDFVDDKNARYDRRCKMQLTTERGLVGNIVQDVITKPAQKQIRIQGSAGFIEWHAHRTDGTDAVIYTTSSEETKTKVIKKKRADDFIGEINHIEALLKGNTVDDSPISLERGLNTMMVVAAAHKSHAQRRIVRINYKAGYTQDALEPVS